MLQEEPGIIINYILEICMPQYTVQKYKEASDVNISLKEHWWLGIRMALKIRKYTLYAVV